MKIKVDEQFAGIRLDKFLSFHFIDRTRAFLQKVIKSGCVVVDDVVVKKPGICVRTGSEVAVEVPEPKAINAKAEKICLDILYEDDDIIVINKPAYMVVHPSQSGAHMRGTLVNAILYHCGASLAGISGELRPGIVHRLDKNTSGVLVVAKTDLAHQSLMKQFSGRKVFKRYIALVRGRVEPEEAIIDSPIGRSFGDRKKMAVVGDGKGREAVTQYKISEVLKDDFGEYSLLDIELKTGRTHQIRVHMNAIKHPVVGDITYGDARVNKYFLKEYGLDRQFLHAAELSFAHPKTRKKLVFKSPLPNDLQEVLDSMNL